MSRRRPPRHRHSRPDLDGHDEWLELVAIIDTIDGSDDPNVTLAELIDRLPDHQQQHALNLAAAVPALRDDLDGRP